MQTSYGPLISCPLILEDESHFEAYAAPVLQIYWRSDLCV